MRLERQRTDHAVAASRERVAEHADAVVERARDNADAVLSEARDNADAVLDAARVKADERDPGSRAHQAVLGAERELADVTLQDERDGADQVLRAEREEYAKAIRSFLPLERESTDRYLRSERIRSDDALDNRDDFLAIVTHDLRDLLGGIVLSSALLMKRGQDDAGGSARSEARRIARYAARMSRLLGDLVDIASIDAGKLAVKAMPGDVETLIAEAADGFQEAASSKDIGLEIRIDGAPLHGVFDHDRILQVLGNLVSNALRYTPRGGKITLAGERDGARVRLSVSDTGAGIPEDALESVFARFSQVGANDRGGLGLGLYISRCLVEAHGGSIRAESARGAGTKVSLTLPA